MMLSGQFLCMFKAFILPKVAVPTVTMTEQMKNSGMNTI